MLSDGGDDRQQVSRACLAIVHNYTMVFLFLSLLGALRPAFRTRADLALENLASAPHPQLAATPATPPGVFAERVSP